MTGEVATQPTRTVSTSVLTRRLLTGLLVAVPAFLIGRQLALTLVGGDEAIAIIFGAAAALAVATLVLARTVSPLVAQQAALQERYEAALADALADPLTGLGNHRAFHEELDRQVEASERYETPLSLALIDLDEFKQINDKAGHAAGDRMLRGFGELLVGSTAPRRSRLPDRWRRVRGHPAPHRPRGRAHRHPTCPGPGAPAVAARRGDRAGQLLGRRLGHAGAGR